MFVKHLYLFYDNGGDGGDGVGDGGDGGGDGGYGGGDGGGGRGGDSSDGQTWKVF